VNVRPLAGDEVALVDAHLPLHRLDQFRRGKSCYLVAWDEETPIGHAHLGGFGAKDRQTGGLKPSVRCG